MSTNQKISNLVEQQFPDFVRDEGPNLVLFLRSYYEWMEQSNNAIEVSKNLLNYQDIDNTYDKYLEYFHREIINTIPRDTLFNKKLLAKHIKDLYRSKGSEASYQLLFRILYNEEIEFYYPGEDILRASDGRWVKETSVRVGSPRTGTIGNVSGDSIVGTTSGASARVDRIVGTIERGIIVDELYLTNISGTFEDGELIRNGANTINATILATQGSLQSVDVVSGGALHQAGDTVSFTSAGGSGATGTVLTVSDTSAVEFYIVDGGSGYQTNSTITVSGGSGSNANFIVSGISNTEIIQLNTDTILAMENVVLNTGPTFVSLGANTSSVSANLASANVSTPLNAALAFANTVVGSISALTMTNYGYGYDTSLPTANVVFHPIYDLLIDDGAGWYKGGNADIQSRNVTGTIVTVSVTQFGAGYLRNENVNINNLSRSGTQAGFGTPVVSGIVSYPGKYIDTKGWLSWNNRLQDNYYYQEFSYVIKSSKFLNTYDKIVKAVLHPSGTKLFGTYTATSSVSTSITVTSNTTYS